MIDPAELAKSAIIAYVRSGRIIRPPRAPGDKLLKSKGAFVCIKKQGRLRGCIGTFLPTRTNLAEEIIYNAVSSAARDPRFLPVNADELDLIEVSVDVLEPPERVSAPTELDPREYGIIVRAGAKQGLLLPDLEGVDSVDQQIAIAKQKAGITSEATDYFRFRVTRFLPSRPAKQGDAT